MIPYETKILENGLTIICSRDSSTPFATLNILYKVGSRNENPEKTGFAHLFEHLMFSGSRNIKDFDREIDLCGGENNAFTTNDFTNYYITLPAVNIETAFRLESDRMLALNINKNSLETQRHVVIEEFKQRYLNRPYGDIFLLMKPEAYKVHPYSWCTIGKTPEHVAHATLEEVKAFYNFFYRPDNAILSVCGNVETEKVFNMAEKWFGDILPKTLDDGRKYGFKKETDIPREPLQAEDRRISTEGRNVPADLIMRAYHMAARNTRDFYIQDIISDLLSEGDSSRLLRHLVKDEQIYSEIDAYITGDLDPGLFIFCGKLSEGVSLDAAEQAIDNEIRLFIEEDIPKRELDKILNKREAQLCFGEINYQNKAANLAYFQMLGNIALINEEKGIYSSITVDEIKREAAKLFTKENSTTLLYRKKRNSVK